MCLKNIAAFMILVAFSPNVAAEEPAQDSGGCSYSICVPDGVYKQAERPNAWGTASDNAKTMHVPQQPRLDKP